MSKNRFNSTRRNACRKITPEPFDLTNLMMPQFSNWAFAEREDKLEEKTFEGLQRIQRAVWEQAEKALDDHMNVREQPLSRRLRMRQGPGSSARCRTKLLQRLQSFYVKMADEYQAHFKKQIELFRAALPRAWRPLPSNSARPRWKPSPN
jgi:signal recognition particle GTPase